MKLEVRDCFLAFERQWTDVHILPVTVLLKQVDSDLAQVISRIRQVDPQDLAAAQQALVVLTQAEHVHLAVLFVPVAPNTLENSGPIVEGVGHDAYLRILKGDLFPTQECVCIWRHGDFSVTQTFSICRKMTLAEL